MQSSTSSINFKPRRTNHDSSILTSIKNIKWTIILITLFIWVFVINFYERSTIKRTINKCQWNNWQTWDNDHDPFNIALLADPQIMDDYSYPNRLSILNYFTKKIIDNYHKRNWEYLKNILDPDSIIFLGDLFDGGRNWDDSLWINEYKRFHKIFNQKANRRQIMSLPGNHDIGFGETVNVTALDRFKAYFGETSSIHDLGNHTIVLLDTISLSDFDTPSTQEHPNSILETLANEPFTQPRILLTHVPLYRDPTNQPCGPLRESTKKFPIMKGLQYQTVIDHTISQSVLSKIQPDIVFSGDDHDYCHIKHQYQSVTNSQVQEADEITVKSCAMNMGISKPAIQLLSLNTNNKNGKTYQTEICYLPSPYSSLISYISLSIASLLTYIWIFIFPIQSQNFLQKIKSYIFKSELGLPIAFEKKEDFNLVGNDENFKSLLIHSALSTFFILWIFRIYYNSLYI
ncbi:hypothetical protein WICMUC_004706 [Wickerhamomyces mucosus]|uniref:Calcineurin-like phosphoesterase domain-containing protein n=1 Tax=Wickerhamomyces mucosus TaxID=1378264 RepID=A0A9P8PHB6_9ASCO|nr:hypothetical protein WICMUC_004706 [Wickerhamomyces mucosus]